MEPSPAAVATATAAAPSSSGPHESVWGRDGFGFDDLVDVVNPLHHLPIVGQVYRGLSGDEVGMLPRIAGGLLFGGPFGAATSIVAAGIEAGTGKGPAAHALALLQGDDAPPVPPPPAGRVARAYAPPAPPVPTPHAAVPAADAAAAEPAPPPAPATPAWSPPISGASARLLAELERGGRPATSTG